MTYHYITTKGYIGVVTVTTPQELFKIKDLAYAYRYVQAGGVS